MPDITNAMGGRKMEAILVFLVGCCLWQQSHGQCNLTTSAEAKDFPDLFKETVLSYQMTTEYSFVGADQSDYVKEYYDTLNKRGRVDVYIDGKSSSYYYYQETNEAFEVNGLTCTSLIMNETSPKFMKEMPTEWNYETKGEPIVRGPSAMFRYGLSTWKSDRSRMVYIGEVEETVRKIKVQQWRRCNKEGETVDYYFTLDTRENTFEEKELVIVPLRVVVSKEGDKSKKYPQIYEIMILQPYVSDESKVFQVPTGKGCTRGDLVYKPKMTKYLESNIFTMAEVVCLNCDGKKLSDGKGEGIWNYYSTFTYAVDQGSSLFAYIYTPWGAIDKNGKQEPGGLKRVVYDGKNGYLYTRDLNTDECTITRQSRFAPLYYFPKGGGYLDLSDDLILYPDQEYDYLDDGYYKGLPVHIYEAAIDGYLLGNRSIGRTIFTRYYFKDKVTDNENVVPGALTAIEIALYPNKDDMTQAIHLTINFYAFSTQIPYRRSLFSVADCFKNSDDSLWVTISFPADPPILSKLQDEGPKIELEVFSSILKNSELNPLRIPKMMLDISNAIYVTFQILEKPPIELDFTGEEKDFTISNTKRVVAISDFKSCGKICTETEGTCWGISICGGLCYLGVDEKSNVVSKSGCSLYRRYSNATAVFSKEMMVNTIREEIKEHRIEIVLPGLGENGAPLQIEANYIDVSAVSGEGGSVNKLGRKTDPRFKEYMPGAKLVKTGEEIKNLGNLGYENCQKLCLDYKQCETVSYCESGPQCILTETSTDDLNKDNFASDGFCTVLSRVYTDHFVHTPGTQLVRSHQKSIKASSSEECAKQCLKESSFTCLSFDFCTLDTAETCLLHNYHFLDSDIKEPKKDNITCGHYYKKYSYDFARKAQQRAVGSKLVPVAKLDLESCAKTCIDMKDGACLGYDFCQDKSFTSTSCILLADAAVTKNTTHSDICDHYTKITITGANNSSPGGTSVAWIGVICFFVAVAVGISLTFGIAYFRSRR